MDINRLRTGEKIAAIAGIALLIIMFLTWFGISQEDAGEISIESAEDLAEVAAGLSASATELNLNAWESFSFIDIILLVTVVVAVGLAVATAMSRSVSLPVAASALTAGFGILSTLLILFRILDTPYDLGREFGVFLGLIAAAAIAYGGWRAMQEEGTTFAGEADRLSDRSSDTGTGTTTGTGSTTPGAGPSTGSGTTPGPTTTPGSQPPPPPPPPPGGQPPPPGGPTV
jgi:hypothetical protein